MRTLKVYYDLPKEMDELRRSRAIITVVLAIALILSCTTVLLAKTAGKKAVQAAKTTAKLAAPTVQASANGMLPGEDKIQKALTPEDIKRLQSYTFTYDYYSNGKNEIRTDHGGFGNRPDDINYAPIESYIQTASAMQNALWNVDYVKLGNKAYAAEYSRNCTKYYDYAGEKYIADSITNKLKIKTYLLVSKDTAFGSGGVVYVRGKYIFYQDSGTKIEESGSTLKKWYWQDVQIPLAAYANSPHVSSGEHKTPEWYKTNVDVIQVFGEIDKLNQPQPYTFK